MCRRLCYYCYYTLLQKTGAVPVPACLCNPPSPCMRHIATLISHASCIQLCLHTRDSHRLNLPWSAREFFMTLLLTRACDWPAGLQRLRGVYSCLVKAITHRIPWWARPPQTWRLLNDISTATNAWSRRHHPTRIGAAISASFAI